MIRWVELIPLMVGGYSVSLEGEGECIRPYLYESEAEVLEEIASMQADYDEQIADSERDKGDLWEGEAHQVSWDGERLYLLDHLGFRCEQINWREQL